MKVSFYVKLFIAFVIFAILLLGFSTFVFNHFYSFHSKKQKQELITQLISNKEEVFKDYILDLEKKLNFLKDVYVFKKDDNLKKDLKKILKNDYALSGLTISTLKGNILFKVSNNGLNLNKIIHEIYSKPYYKNIRTLKENNFYHFYEKKDRPVLVSILRNTDSFFILEIDLNNILKDYSIYHNKEFKELIDKKSFISKNININNEQYFIFISEIKHNFDVQFFSNYYESVIIIGLLLSIFLALLFSKPIASLNKSIEEKNQALDEDIKKSFKEQSQSQKLIDKYIIFIKIDTKNRIIDISRAFAYLSGYSKSELIGQKYKKILKNENKDLFQNLKKIVKNKKAFSSEIEIQKKDGSSLWLRINVEANYDEKVVKSFTIIATDISDKIMIQDLYEDLNHQNTQYNAIFENVDSGIALIDLDGNFKKINHVFTKLLGYSNEDLINMSFLELVFKDSKEILVKLLLEVKELGYISNIEQIFLHKDGNEVHLEVSFNLLSDEKHFVFVVNSLEDKRKLQELNQNLELRIKEEVEKSIQKDKLHQQEQIKNAKLTSIGSLAAGIAHEINTPLTYIKGNLELMYYDILDLPESSIQERMKTDSEKMQEGIDRIANIVDSMREMSQSTKEVKENTNIYATLITSLTMAHNRSKQVSKIYLNNKLFNINTSSKDEFEFFSIVQKQRIEQVWIIIVNNALDELVKIEDYEKRNLSINIKYESDEIIVRFKDNAGGIKEDIIEDIFEPFMSSKEHSGMGVGLNIAKKIVEEQEGTIIAFNEDEGAVFEVRLKAFEEISNS
jgi:PAS domain S-box-containing protein